MSGRPVCMVVHAYYDEDPRVRREAEALVRRGRPVDVFALRRKGDPAESVVEGVSVRRLPVRRHQGASVARYLAEYLDFFVRAMTGSALANLRRKYALVQVHTLPDFLVFAALPLRAAGVPVILDLHEAMPEFFASRFPARRFARVLQPVAVGLLRVQERLAIRAANAVITVNDSLADRLVRLGTPRDKLTVVLNAPVLERFAPVQHPAREFMEDGTLRLVYAGAVTPTYELPVVVRAMAEIARERPKLRVELDVYGRGDLAGALDAEARELGIGDRLRLHGRIALEHVPIAIASADIGLAPTRRDRFTELTISTKLFEYAAMEKPLIASRLETVARYFPDGSITTYEPGDASDLAAAVLRLVDDPADRDRRVRAAARRVHELSWERESERYVELVERLARDG